MGKLPFSAVDKCFWLEVVVLGFRIVTAWRDFWSSSPAAGQDCSSWVRVLGAAIAVNHHFKPPLGPSSHTSDFMEWVGWFSIILLQIADSTVFTNVYMVTPNNPIIVFKWVKWVTVPRLGSSLFGPGVRRESRRDPHTASACNLCI